MSLGRSLRRSKPCLHVYKLLERGDPAAGKDRGGETLAGGAGAVAHFAALIGGDGEGFGEVGGVFGGGAGVEA